MRTSSAASVAALVAALALAGCGADDPAPAASGPLPVITPDEEWDDRPLAGVSGRLSLRKDCLLLDGQLVFWPHGTAWDDAEQSVVFEDADPVAVGEDFDGGGGYWDLRGDDSGPLDAEEWLGADAGAALRSCAEKTGVTALVLAYPSTAPDRAAQTSSGRASHELGNTGAGEVGAVVDASRRSSAGVR